MAYESQFERFEAFAPDGGRCAVEFVRAGFLTSGDQPELYFFRMAGQGDEIVVGISGSALKRFQHGRKSLSREAKIDLTGLFLKMRIEAGMALASRNLFLQDEELAQLAGKLGILV